MCNLLKARAKIQRHTAAQFRREARATKRHEPDAEKIRSYFNRIMLKQLVLSWIAFVIFGLIIAQQDDHAARCGPFFNWRPCPDLNNEPQCCSKWGFCSETSTRAQICAQQDIGDYFWNPTTLCTTDADCQQDINPGPFICSQEVDTKGACALKAFHNPFNGTNPYGIPKTTAASPIATPAIHNVDQPGQNSNPQQPASQNQDQPTSSSISTSQVSVVMSVAMILAAFILIGN